MNESLRGFIQEYANDKDKTMPSAYRDLLELGLILSSTKLENFRPSVDMEEHDIQVMQVEDMKEEEQYLVLERHSTKEAKA